MKKYTNTSLGGCFSLLFPVSVSNVRVNLKNFLGGKDNINKWVYIKVIIGHGIHSSRGVGNGEKTTMDFGESPTREVVDVQGVRPAAT